MKITAVILNYNDADGTVDAVKRISGFLCFENIVVVDNASTDDSAVCLERELDSINAECGHHDRVHFIKSPVNGGYGSGNNLGVRYAFEAAGAELAVIANPDSVFSEELVEHMREIFESDKDAGAVGAVMLHTMPDSAGDSEPGGNGLKLSYNDFIHSGWKRRSVAANTLNGGPVTGRLFKSRLNYPIGYYKNAERAVRVYAVHGSLLMVNAAKFLDAGGFDEKMFLYGEESVLGEKFSKSGFHVWLLKETYLHRGSESITGSGIGAVRRQKFRNESENYYYMTYLGAGNAEMKFVRLFQFLVMLETKIASKWGMR